MEQAQESIRFIDPKNRTLANGARMRHPTLKVTRGLAFAHPNNPLALPKCGAPGEGSNSSDVCSFITSDRLSVIRQYRMGSSRRRQWGNAFVAQPFLPSSPLPPRGLCG